jgi:hypothetical protein
VEETALTLAVQVEMELLKQGAVEVVLLLTVAE